MGAQGIAQFMPATAAMRGLVNAFEPLQALRESASYLRELRMTFRGNLGLAAAAYNAGPAAVEAWLAGRGYLPFETQAYVRIVTGYAAEAWIAKPTPQLETSARADRRALRRAGEGPPRERAPSPAALVQPGLGTMGRPACRQLVRRRRACRLRTAAAQIPVDPGRPAAAGHEQPPGRAVHRSRLGKDPAPMRTLLCAKLHAAGGACIVLRNPRD